MTSRSRGWPAALRQGLVRVGVIMRMWRQMIVHVVMRERMLG